MIQEIPIQYAVSTATLIPAIMLVLVDTELRRKNVVDKSVRLLWLGLMVYSLYPAISLLSSTSLISNVTLATGSAANNILFTLAALNMLGVRDLRLLRRWKTTGQLVVSAVATLSLASILFALLGEGSLYGAMLGSLGSLITTVSLGAAMTRSFFIYGSSRFALLAMIVFLLVSLRQITFVAVGGTISDYQLVAGLALNSAVGVLFLTLVLTWSLSRVSALKIVGGPRPAQVAVLFFDLRGSTEWAQEVGDNLQVLKFMNALRIWAMEIIGKTMTMYDPPHLVKYLGDGYLCVWEKKMSSDCVDQLADSALKMSEEYTGWAKSLPSNEHVRHVPASIGVGIDFGSALQISNERGEPDYIGKSVNYAAKLQGAARPHGGVGMTEALWKSLNKKLQEKFSLTREVALSEKTSITARVTTLMKKR